MPRVVATVSVALAAILTGCRTTALSPIRDYGVLRQEARGLLATLREQTSEAQAAGIDVARERVTITTAGLFLTYAEWDHEHTAELEEAIASWWRVRKDAPRLAAELPIKELQDLNHVLREAMDELKAVQKGELVRRPGLEIDMTALREENAYLRQGDRPVFPSTFVWQPDEEELNRAYGVIGGKYIHLPHIKAEGQKPDIGYEPDDDEPLGYIFLGQKYAPKWLIKKHPEITDGKHYYTGFDTDHPVARDLWASMLADIVPQFRGRRVSQGGYMLTNEPHWFTCTEGWATGPVSEKTKTKFRNWLGRRHRDIAALNALWGTDFASFADVIIEVPIDASLRGKPIWYDWCRFNMDRVTDWFTFLKTEIRKHDPAAQTHIKLIPGHLARHSRCHGLDFEALVRLQDIIGCDASILTTPHWKDPESWPERYACNWREQALPLDFFRSISPEKLIFDSEWHGLSTANSRDLDMPGEYVRAALWLAHLHGTGMNQTWYWSRGSDGALCKKDPKGFYASNLTQPRVMNSYGRTMKELNAFAPEIVALGTQPKRVRIFYSEASAIQDKAYMDHVYEAYKALYHSGMPLGFATARTLTEATDTDMEQWPVIIAPHADHVTTADRNALKRYLAQRGTLLVVGDQCLKHDEYGRPGPSLTPGEGHVIHVDATDAAALSAHLISAGLRPAIALTETNEVGLPGCVWRTAPWQGGHLLLIINLGKSTAAIEVETSSPCRDMISGGNQRSAFRMRPFGVKLLHVGEAER